MNASKCCAAACRFILSTSNPVPSGEAGEFFVPVVVMPTRKYDPLTFRHIPMQRAVALQLVRQIDHTLDRN